jgi:HEPN domain-containing protein
MGDDIDNLPPEDGIAQWFWYSDYEMTCARDSLEKGRLLYVYFHCQQALEKRLKGMYARATLKTPPYTHGLMPLAKLCGLELSPEQRDLMVALTALYSEVRYPGAQPPEAHSPEFAAETLALTEETLLWLDHHRTF